MSKQGKNVKIIRSTTDIRCYVADRHAKGQTVALVPTMGGLHLGHLSLIELAAAEADKVVVTIFVNPKQFNNPDDLKTYPSDEQEDLAKLDKTKADVVYIPALEEMYPGDFATHVSVKLGSDIMDDLYRPGHFDGVTTVVSKLFIQTGADFATFGEKDFQQLSLIKQMVKDLNIPITILPAPTIRESDGLAMSSRNANLSTEHKRIAPVIHQTMLEAREAILAGKEVDEITTKAKENLEEVGFKKVEYFELHSGQTLELLDKHEPNARLFCAAWLGDVRLIDNIAI